MDWTKELQVAARAEGWAVHYCLEHGERTGAYRIFGERMTNAQALKHVIERARARSDLHVAALRAVMQSRANQPKKKAKR